jgi:hypothetical protein
MKFHEPEWVGKDIQCTYCRAKFTLEAEDEKLVKYIETTKNGIVRYWINCPKCNDPVCFQVDINNSPSSVKHIPAPLFE